jgi:coenzyme F420-dependent glucose-6-phosphate dehydrogenase
VVKIGYHCSHEQFSPRDLLGFVKLAEQAGFAGAMCSDHFHPWSNGQGQSGFAWSWLGAALEATSLPFGVVNAPGQRYHSAVIAQAAATLSQMYPQRFWLALGSGQCLNEHITGDPWVSKADRWERLKECAAVIRALWRGETVNHQGRVTVQDAKLYSLPAQPPLLIGAAVSAATAQWVGSWADGLITVVKPGKKLQQVVDAFRRGGGEGKPMFLQAQTCYASDEDEALAAAYDQWRPNALPSDVLPELSMPEDFERAARLIQPEDLKGPIRISSDTQQHIEWLRDDIEMGFTSIYVHQVGRNQKQFLDAFGDHVLPALGQ